MRQIRNVEVTDGVWVFFEDGVGLVGWGMFIYGRMFISKELAEKYPNSSAIKMM